VIVCILVFLVGVLIGPIVQNRLFAKKRFLTPFQSNENLFPPFKTDSAIPSAPSPLAQKSDGGQKATSQKKITP
jgi:hypothetical protein